MATYKYQAFDKSEKRVSGIISASDTVEARNLLISRELNPLKIVPGKENKSKTKISDNVFIGSNSSLVAPIKIDKDSVVGAGSVITKNVKKKSLALTRSSQLEIKNYKMKKRKKKK